MSVLRCPELEQLRELGDTLDLLRQMFNALWSAKQFSVQARGYH